MRALLAAMPAIQGKNIRDWTGLAAIWAIVTAYNLFKPYHIDDTAYLEIARWIESHPLHPMSGVVNWTGVAAPISEISQPHLYFYLLALWGWVFGFGEPATHALQSLAALASIVLFYRLARLFAASSALWAVAMLAFGPAFVVEQNLMVDVPLLALWLAFFNLLICAVGEQHQTRRYVLAGLACAAALLTKYSSLVLLPILGLSLLEEHRRTQAWTFLIPIAALLAWSMFNYWDYGGVHIAPRLQHSTPGPGQTFRLAIAWFIGLGALTPLGVIAAVQRRPGSIRKGWLIYARVFSAFVILVAAVALGLLSDRVADKLLWAAFAANAGLISCALAPDLLALTWRKFWPDGAVPAVRPQLYAALWLAATSMFYVLFAPFMASRHVLLIIPAVILLLVARWNAQLTRASKVFGLALTVVVSAGLCVSDWRFAAFYRDEAAALAVSLPRTNPIWASGHWGWQWYAALNGFPQVDVKSSPLATGDVLLMADDEDHQPLSQAVTLRLLRTDTEAHPLRNLFCTGRPVRFYAYGNNTGPWSLSLVCLRHLSMFRIEAAERQ